MSQNPLNLAIRFLLELFALYAIGYWGWNSSEGVLRYLLVIGLPLAAASMWGIFRTPNEPNHTKEGLVNVPGKVRLLIEFMFFGFAIWGYYTAGVHLPAILFCIVILLHYLISYDRIIWMIKN